MITFIKVCLNRNQSEKNEIQYGLGCKIIEIYSGFALYPEENLDLISTESNHHHYWKLL